MRGLTSVTEIGEDCLTDVCNAVLTCGDNVCNAVSTGGDNNTMSAILYQLVVITIQHLQRCIN